MRHRNSQPEEKYLPASFNNQSGITTTGGIHSRTAAFHPQFIELKTENCLFINQRQGVIIDQAWERVHVEPWNTKHQDSHWSLSFQISGVVFLL